MEGTEEDKEIEGYIGGWEAETSKEGDDTVEAFGDEMRGGGGGIVDPDDGVGAFGDGLGGAGKEFNNTAEVCNDNDGTSIVDEDVDVLLLIAMINSTLTSLLYIPLIREDDKFSSVPADMERDGSLEDDNITLSQQEFASLPSQKQRRLAA
ncbi:hypothetical protein BHYA_0417g00060 [Botrytis hyacinthi]|uniref:Uncharacterized protein n=1 Tax=Botrytis hyacinthi TaxID=278943 RepID=A0A4Z1G9Q0_9HELO|nr:hypothetical protein BHYA_0417g00060 [Botrytis hyacinthi]